jgi:hypothetical protein
LVEGLALFLFSPLLSSPLPSSRVSVVAPLPLS